MNNVGKAGIDPAFATPIYNVDCIDNLDNITKEIENCLPKIDWKSKDEWGTTHYLSTDNFSEDLFKQYKLNNLREQIQKHMISFCKAVGYIPTPYRMEAWFTKFEKGNYAHIHNHGTADISGVYYVQTTGDDGSIFFTSPCQAATCSHVFQHVVGSARPYTPKKGTMIMFPSYLEHGVQTNDTDNTRISLSFNISFQR
tara:strand:+ start:629 stop:1222 length:594 start_codon:yes stop_codon:yes gene_type:complete